MCSELLDSAVNFLPIIAEIVASLFIIMGMFFLRPVRYKLLGFLYSSMSKAHGFKAVSKEDTLFHRRVNDAVVELRCTVSANRVNIYQFENGNRFSLSNPTWKITQTYETVSDGKMYFSDTIQRAPISHFLELLIPLFSPNEKYTGIEKINVNNSGRVDFVLRVDSNFLPDCRYKYELLRRGSEVCYLFPLKNEANKIFSICSIEYSYKKNMSDEDLLTSSEITHRIQAYLNSIFIDSLGKL